MKSLWQFIRNNYAILAVLCVFAWACATIVRHRAKEAPPGTITLRVAHWQLEPGVRDGFRILGEEYQKMMKQTRDIDVRIVQDLIPESTYGQWASTQLMGGTASDIVEIGLGLPAPMWLAYLNRYFMPLTPYVMEPNPYNKGEAFANTAWRQTFTDGMRAGYREELQEYMTVPLSQFNMRLFYNKDLLRKLTGSDQAPPDYRGFLAACAKIAEQKSPTTGRAYVPIAGSGYNIGMWETNLCELATYGLLRRADFNRDATMGNDEFYVAIRTGMIRFDDPAIKTRFQMVHELTQHFPPGFTGLSRDDGVFLFTQQRAVFMTTGTWDAEALRANAKGQFEVGMMNLPLPLSSDPEYGRFFVGPRYEQGWIGIPMGITRTCKHPEIALDFLQYLSSRRGNQEFNRIVGWVPAISGAEPPPFMRGFEPNMSGIYPAFNVNLGGETFIKWQQINALFQVNQCTFEKLAEEFVPFYIERGKKDWTEQQRDWRRGLQKNEQMLAATRAKALDPKARDTEVLWARYRNLTVRRQLWPETVHQAQVRMLEQGFAPDAVGPYEFTPAAYARLGQEFGKSAGVSPATKEGAR